MERWAKAVNAQKTSQQQQQLTVMKTQKETETVVAAEFALSSMMSSPQQPLVSKMADSGSSSLFASVPVSTRL